MNKIAKKLKEWLPLTLALCAAVILYVILTHIPSIWRAVRTFFGYFSPLILGIVIAYVVNPLSEMFRKSLFRKVRKEKRQTLFSNALAFLTVIAVIVLMLLILIPQLIDSISTFVSNLDGYLASVKAKIPQMKLFGNALDLQDYLESREKLLTMATEMLRNNADTLLKTSLGAGRSVMQWVIALFLSIYLLSDKANLKKGLARLFSALTPENRRASWAGFLRRCDEILNRYVVFNLLDALVIGCINAMFMAIAGIPYVGLVSFIVGVTNLIPTFGPIIGAVIGALLLALVKLRYAIIFLIFTVVLQIFDGYLVKPKLFGTSLGVSSLWILVGVVVGGRMFGTAGMLLAIPAVAIIDDLYSDYFMPWLERRARRREEAKAQELEEVREEEPEQKQTE